jgi:hypothetical protein
MNVQSEELAALLAYVQADERICPQPQRWNDLWKMRFPRYFVFQEVGV